MLPLRYLSTLSARTGRGKLQRYSPLIKKTSLVKNSNLYFTTLGEKGLRITENAVEKLKKLKLEEKNNDLKLRVTINSGGCSGYSIDFSLDDKAPEKTDIVIEQNGEHVVIDDISLGLIEGAKVDYIDELARSSFVVLDIPNTDTSCGCSTSFSLK